MWTRILVAIMLLVASQQVEREEIDSNVQQISDFLLDLISRYDESGQGSISIEKYPHFLADVMNQGYAAVSPGSEVPQETKALLLEATRDFAKKYNTTEVGVQDFYFDLIKEFTTYLLDHEDQYTPILETFFGDTPFADTPNEGFGQEAESSQQQDVKQEAIEL